jgi:hypothetical protein
MAWGCARARGPREAGTLENAPCCAVPLKMLQDAPLAPNSPKTARYQSSHTPLITALLVASAATLLAALAAAPRAQPLKLS